MRRPNAELDPRWKFLELPSDIDLTLFRASVRVHETFFPCRDLLQFLLIIPYSICHTKDKILVLTIVIGHRAAGELCMSVKQMLVLIYFLEADHVPERFSEIISSEYLLRQKFFPMLPFQKVWIYSVKVFSKLLS